MVNVPSQVLEFPGLGIHLELNRVAFYLGGMPIYWYGILMGLAFIVAAAYLLSRVKAFGLDGDRVIDVLLGTIVGGIIGARLYYVAFSWDTYKDDPMKIFSIREGGLAIYGGIIAAALAAYLMCRLRKVKFQPLCDLFLSALLVGQAIGRWGNFVNIEAFGGNTTAPWGMTGPSIVSYLTYHQESLAAAGMVVDPSLPVHPTFFYESLWCLVGFVLLALFTKHRRYDGELSFLYLFWYGLGRSYIEGLRTDSLMLGSVRVSQILAILCVIVAAGVLIFSRMRIKKADDPQFMQLYVDTEEGQAVLAGTFYPKKGKEAEPAEKSDAEDKEPEEDESAEEEPEAEDTAEEEQEADESEEGEASEDETAKEAPAEEEGAEDETDEPQ